MGRIWEHYDQADWSDRLGLQPDDKTNIFRPWGFQPGHFTEWTKLLLLLSAMPHSSCDPATGWMPRADSLFDDRPANEAGTREHGGVAYGFAPDGSICDSDKYCWVQAESLAAAARLATVTGEQRYWAAYDHLWAYAWRHFVDHEHGAWWRILTADNRKYSDEKSPAGKVDYHTMGACHDVLDSLLHG